MVIKNFKRSNLLDSMVLKGMVLKSIVLKSIVFNRTVLSLAFMAALCLGTVSVQAASQGQPYHPPVAAPKGALITPEQAVAAAQSAEAGRVLGVTVTQREAKSFYRIKMLTGEGRVSVVFVDAETGMVQSP